MMMSDGDFVSLPSRHALPRLPEEQTMLMSLSKSHPCTFGLYGLWAQMGLDRIRIHSSHVQEGSLRRNPSLHPPSSPYIIHDTTYK